MEPIKPLSLRVCARVRPLLRPEREQNCQACLVVNNRQNTISINMPASGSLHSEKLFQFDGCFNDSIDQKQLFDLSGVKTIVDTVFRGERSCVLAYGASGSGKTHTMCGNLSSSHDIGIIGRSSAYVFEKLSHSRGSSVRASFCEIYNENVFDLLNTSNQSLEIRSNSIRGSFVDGLLEVICTSEIDVMEVLNEGVRNRSVSSHCLNDRSSRSHAIFTLEVSNPTSNGKLLFVDLAGSERLDLSQNWSNVGETGMINKSLLCLTRILTSLSSSSTHVPYRDSSLTWLLKDVLHSSSMIICCLSPSNVTATDSLIALTHATCSRGITTTITRKESVMNQLKSENYELKAENDLLRQEIERLSLQQQVQDDVSVLTQSPTNKRKKKVDRRR